MRSPWPGLSGVALLLACGDAIIEPPEPDPEVPAPRVDLAIKSNVAPDDAALAALLGLGDGLAGAQVTARHADDAQEPQTGATDDAGQVVLPQLVEGEWMVVVRRPLSASERALLDSANSQVMGFGGAAVVTLVPAAANEVMEVMIEADAVDWQGGLVISEAHVPTIDTPEVYLVGQYIEVHNNSFDTVQLDGKMLGLITVSLGFDIEARPCSSVAQWREDPAGIWTREFYLFPGSGRDYPLVPGASAVVAINAEDHSRRHPELLDLSGADFEFIGVGDDADEPRVPNMRNVFGFSRSDGPPPVTQGPSWRGEIGLFLADALDLATLAQDSLPLPGAQLHVRVPREAILDVLTSGSLPEYPFRPSYCDAFVHPSFDAQYAELVDVGSLGYSLARRAVIGPHPALRLVSRTGATAEDFIRSVPSPGRAP